MLTDSIGSEKLDWAAEKMVVTICPDWLGGYEFVVASRRGATFGRLTLLVLITAKPVRRHGLSGRRRTETAQEMLDRLAADKVRELFFRLYPEKMPRLLCPPGLVSRPQAGIGRRDDEEEAAQRWEQEGGRCA